MIKVKRLVKSFSHALRGLNHTLFFHQNLRIHTLVAALVIFLGFLFKITALEWAVVSAAIFFVLVAEMVNTSIEEIVDLVRKEHHSQARIAKDVAAGMVLLAAIFSLVIGLIVFLPYFLK